VCVMMWFVIVVIDEMSGDILCVCFCTVCACCESVL